MVTVWVSLIMIFSFIVVVVEVSPPAKAALITVDDDGLADYSNIQDAIDASSDGDTIFLYNGTEPTSNQFIHLHPGWNLVGFPSLSNKDRANALNNLVFDTHVDAIWTFNASSQKWAELDEPTDYFELCRGYWIHATQECVWEVPL